MEDKTAADVNTTNLDEDELANHVQQDSYDMRRMGKKQVFNVRFRRQHMLFLRLCTNQAIEKLPGLCYQLILNDIDDGLGLRPHQRRHSHCSSWNWWLHRYLHCQFLRILDHSDILS